MFGTKEAPALPYRRNQIADLAKQVVRAQTTLPGVQAKLSLDINPGGKNEPYKFTIVGLWGRYILKPQTDTCPTSASPLAYGLSTRSPFRTRPPKTVPPRPLFHPKSQPHISTKYLYPPLSGPITCMILWNVMGWVTNGHAQYSATRNGMKRRAAEETRKQPTGYNL